MTSISKDGKRQASLSSFFGKSDSPKKRRKISPPKSHLVPLETEIDDGDDIVFLSNGMDAAKAVSTIGTEEDKALRMLRTGEKSKNERQPSDPDKSDCIPAALTCKLAPIAESWVDPFIEYPPPNHPSYHLPPRPHFNHPITITPPPLPLISSLKFSQTPKVITSPQDLDVLYFTRFIQPPGSRRLVEYLLKAMPWYRVNYVTKGIDVKTPRYTTVFGKDSTGMPWDQYSKWEPRAIPEILLRLMQQVEKVTGETYNFALINYYSSGTDSISYHSDSERFLGPNPCIASISLGASRDFCMRHIDYKKNGLPVQKFTLNDGDMVVMKGTTQHKWEHSIPKRAKAEGRINITFRKGIVQYATENYLTYNVGKGPMYRWEGGKMVEKG